MASCSRFSARCRCRDMGGLLPPTLLKRVRTLALRGRRATDALLGGDVRSVFRGTGMEFADVRPYTEGDDVRHLDWNLLARTGQPYIKLYTETRELTLLLVVDRSASTGIGVPDPKLARGVEVAAMLALVAEQQHDRVGLVAFGERVGPIIPPGRGQRHAWHVVRRLFDLEVEGAATDLVGALHTAGALLKRRAMVVVVSDFIASGWETPLRGLAARHDVTAITVDDAREARLPERGWITLEGAEQGQRVLFDAGDRRARQRVTSTLARSRQQRRAALASAGVRQVEVDTAGDYLPALRAAFGRGRRQR